MKNPIAWVEIPVKDMDRAINFYNKGFGWNLAALSLGQLQMAILPNHKDVDGISGALVYHREAYTVSDDHAGPLVYLFCTDIDDQMSKIEAAGGKCILPRRLIREDYGSMGLFLDSENNRMALFSKET